MVGEDSPSASPPTESGSKVADAVDGRELVVSLDTDVPVSRWEREGTLGTIRRRLRRITAVGVVALAGLTFVPTDGAWSLLVGTGQVVSILTAATTWAMATALAEDGTEGGETDTSVLAATGVIGLVFVSRAAERSSVGLLLWRALLGDPAPEDRPGTTGSALGTLVPVVSVVALLLGSVVLLLFFSADGLGGFALAHAAPLLGLTVVVGGLVGFLLAFWLR